MSHTTTFQNATLKVIETQGASSNTAITPNAINIIGINNDQSENTNYSTSASVDSLVPTIPYIRGNSIANNAFTIGGHYADYTSGNSLIKRIYTGFYRDANPSLGAVSASTQDGLLDPLATSVDITVRSSLDLGTKEIKNASNIKTTTITDINNQTGTAGQLLSSTSTGIDWVTPPAIVSTQPFYITATSPLFQVPPVATPSSIADTYQYYGWYFINSSVGRKISWYFAPDYAMTVSDIQGLYMNYFNITATSNENVPFISVYTKPTGTNDAIPGFAHSVATYVPTFTPIVNTPFCSFMNISGVEPDPFPYGHQLGAMVLSPVQPNPRGEYLGTEEVLAIAVGTSSSSTTNQVSFVMSKVGVCLTQGNAELILYPQNIYNLSATTVTATTSVKPTTILDLNNQAGTAGQILSSTATGIDWIDAPSGTTPNISQVITAGGDAGGGSITNLASLTATTSVKPTTILDSASSAGSAGQYLASNGSALTWTALPSAPTPTLSEVLVAGNSADATNIDMNLNQVTNASFFIAVDSLAPATTSQVQVSGDQVTVIPTPPGAFDEYEIMSLRSDLLRFQHQIGLTATTATVLSPTALSVETDFNIAITNSSALTLNGTTGATGEVITADVNGTPYWASPATPYISATGVASGGITSLPSINASGAMTIGGDVATTGLTIGSGNYTTAMGGNVGFGGNSVSGLNNIDGNSTTLSIGRGATTTNNISIGKSGVAIDLNNTVRFGADGAVSAGTAGQVVTSGGAGAFTRWANIALTNVAGAELTPNASASSPFQLFTSTAITGTVGSTYLFMFRTNLSSSNSAGTDNEMDITLTTTTGNTTPTTSNSFNVLNPSVTILNTRPDELTSLAFTKHYGALGIGVRQDRTLTFSYLYTFPSATTTTFGVWSWTNTTFPTSSFIRKNVQLNYIKLS